MGRFFLGRGNLGISPYVTYDRGPLVASRDACKSRYADCLNLDKSLTVDASVLKYAEAVAPSIIRALDEIDLKP